MTPALTAAIAPFFIVRNVSAALSFYCDVLGFKVIFSEPDTETFFAIVQRDGAMIFLKDVGVDPLPNHQRHQFARWDAYVYVPDPEALAAEFTAKGASFSVPLQDTNDGLIGFELEDADGYVLFFGRTKDQ